MGDTTLYDTTAPSAGSVALAHERLIRQKIDGMFRNITGDVNNLSLNPAPVTVQREVYGQKGAQSTNVLNRNYAPSFDVEVVRDPVTKRIVAAQDWVLDLVRAAYANGDDNKRDFQIFTDAMDERMPVLEGRYSVTVSEGSTGYADKGVLSFTLNNDGNIKQIDSPLAGTGAPTLESVSPAGQAAGEQVVIRGYYLSDVTEITFDGTAVTDFSIVDAYSVVAVIPEAVTGTVDVVVTNAAGASDPTSYAAA